MQGSIENWASDHGRKWQRLLYKGTVKRRIPSKKNSRQLGVIRATGRPFSVPSKAYTKTKPIFIEQLLESWNLKMIVEPCLLKLRVYEHSETWFKLYLKGDDCAEPKGADVDNNLASIQDILTDARIINDDALIVEVNAYKMIGVKHPDFNEFGADVELYGLDTKL